MADVTKLNNGTTTYNIKDATAVHVTGNETIGGAKTFSSDIIGHCTRDALDSAAVHNTGTETIAGVKKFSDTPLVGCLPGIGMYKSITENSDLNTIEFLKVGTYTCVLNNTVATLQNCPTNGEAFIMYVLSQVGNVGDESTMQHRYRIRIIYDIAGKCWIQKANSGSIVGQFNYGTWKKVSTDDEVVKLTGGQTISGEKIFNSDQSIVGNLKLKTTSDDPSVVPAISSERAITFPRGEGNIVNTGAVANVNSSDGNMKTMMWSCKKVNNVLTYATISCEVSSSGERSLKGTNLSAVKGSAFAAVGMPNLSNKVNLTLPSEQGGVIIPSSQYNGWVMMTATTPNPNPEESGIVILYAGTNIGVQSTKVTNGVAVRVVVPVEKGQGINVWWSTCTVQFFQFIKANAEVA